jgi:hypothetical protein
MTAVLGITKTTVTTHTVEIRVAGAPILPTHSYYEPGLMYTPDLLGVEWDEGEAPTGVDVYGDTTKGTRCKRGYELKQSPQWVREAVIESIEEAKDWDWTPWEKW